MSILLPPTAMAKRGSELQQKTILIADDHAIVRDGVARIIRSDFPTFHPKPAITHGAVIESVRHDDLALVVTDVSITGSSGIDLIKEIASLRPLIPILVFSMHTQKDYGVRSIKSGAWGYIQKSEPLEELSKAIGQVLAGKRYVSPELAQNLVSCVRKDKGELPHERLSAREFQILAKLTNGGSIKDIAADLLLSVKTVSTYRVRIFKKLEVKSIADLVRYAIDHNLK